MPLPINIQELFTGRLVEWERLEFKEGWNPESILHTVCAFANDFHNWGGGYILLGVEEHSGQPVLPPKGLDAGQVDAIQKHMLELGHKAIQPSYHPIMEPTTVAGRQVLVIWVPGGQTRPYKAKVSLAKDAKEWAYYIRKGSSTVQAKGNDARELLSLAATVPFDDRMHLHAQLDDLSSQLIVGFLDQIGSELAEPARSMSLEKLGHQMGITAGPEEAPLPRNVGLLFFNPEPYRFFPQTQIDVLWFPEGEGGNRFDEKIFRGPLGRMVREALDFIQRNYLHETVIKHPDRPETTRISNFPYAAVEEAVVNAVYHRSYEEREPVEVRIRPDELAVLSFPGPDRSIDMNDLRRGNAVSRRYRNRRVGEFLKEMDLTEGRATGIPKILRAMRENGSPRPRFDTDADRTSFLICLPVHPLAKSVMEDTSALHVTPHVTPQATPYVSPHVRKLLRTLNSAGEMSAAQILKIFGIKDRVHLRKAYLIPAQEADMVEMTIPHKPKSPLQTYRLTDLGKAWLAKSPHNKG